jgi:hypothetical protein
MAAEIEAERIYQQLQKIKRANESPDQVIAKTEPKQEPIKPEQPPVVAVENKTTEQRKKDRINAKRRARYQLKKLVKSELETKPTKKSKAQIKNSHDQK